MGGKNRTSLKVSNAFTTMLSHKLRAENDAILVGRGTLEADHPRLNTREWSGADPERIILSHTAEEIPDGFQQYDSIDGVLSHLYNGQKQSLIVEGGANVLQQFIDRDLWDDIRVETAPFTIAEGVKAPALPGEARPYIREEYDGNTICWYRHARN